MSIIGKVHEGFVYNRRVRVLASRFSELLPIDARVLDVGCGDGMVDYFIMAKRPDVSISGIDVFVREQTHIPVTVFDGKALPYDAGSFDVVVLIDVLHHADRPEKLLQEAKRVSRGIILIKDHTMEGVLAGLTLRIMDWVGNAHHEVDLPYNYWHEKRWHEVFAGLNLSVMEWNARLDLYPWPLAWLFERSLHFIAKLTFDHFNDKMP